MPPTPNPALLVTVALVALGLRLLAKAIRGRTLPEALLGAGFCLGSLGMAVLALVSEGGFDPAPGVVIAQAIVNAGLSLFAVFCQRVFRPGLGWARALAAGTVAALAASWAILAAVSGSAPGTDWPHTLITATRLVPFGWLGVETALCYGRQRRQQRLGLGDPLVGNRFLLWSVWNAGLLAVPLIALAFLSRGVSPEASPLFLTLASPLGAVAGIALWLSFFPPLRYRRWLLDRAAARAV